MTDTLPGAIDPPLPESEAPLLMNPVLARRSTSRRGQANLAWYIGVPLALIVICGGAYLMVDHSHQGSLMASSATTAQSTATTTTTTPAPAPVAETPAPPPPMAQAAPAPTEAPVAPVVTRPERMARAETRTEHRTAERHYARAQSSDTSGIDESGAPAPAAAMPAPAPAPAVIAPPAAPPVIAPPVITPPAPNS